MATQEGIFDRDEQFWNNYLQGRPQAPESFFNRIFNYHQTHGGEFGTVHDVGAGNGPYAQRLRKWFGRVILSDIATSAIELAKSRLGSDGFEYRVANMEEANDISAHSVDMVFATNVMHFVDPVEGMTAAAKQLKSGGTFACACFGPARFEDDKLQDLWERMSQQGGRQMLEWAKHEGENDYEDSLACMAKTEGHHKVAPMDESNFRSGAHRIHLNMSTGGLTGLIPPEVEYDRKKATVEDGPHDVVVFEEDPDWRFETDVRGVRGHMLTFPFIIEDDEAFKPFFKELDELVKSGEIVRGVWPAKIILATRR